LWLSLRVARDPGSELLFVCIVGVLLGAEPGIGIALCPALLLATVRMARRRDGKRALGHAALLFVCGAFIAYLAAGRHAAPSLVPSWDRLTACSLDASRSFGACGCALAALGVSLAVTSESGRWRLAIPALLLACSGAALGRANAVTLLALALAVGLALSEVAARMGRVALPGAMSALVPLVFVVLLEPMAMRLQALHGNLPSLGPVPPTDTPTSTRPRTLPFRVRATTEIPKK
jgi:hypothetical protein